MTGEFTAADEPVAPRAADVSFLRDADLRARAYFVKFGSTEQSYVDLDDPTHLEFEYVQRIAESIDIGFPDGDRLRAVHIGGGGLTLPRYLAHTRPTSAQLVLEPDVGLTQLVRERLPLPRASGIKVRGVDGRTGLAAIRDDYADLIVLDAFAGARVPAELTTVEFLADCRRVLDAGGLLLINVTDLRPLDYTRRLVAGVRRHFPFVVLSAEPSTLKGRRFGNLVVQAGDREPDLLGLERAAARAAFPFRLLHDASLDRFVGAATPFTDADSAMSPPPPGGPF